MKESTFWRNHLKPLLVKEGWLHERMAFNSVGQTDCFAFKNGVFIGIELKSLTAKTIDGCFAELKRKHTPIQQRWRDKIVKAGGMHYLMGTDRKRRTFCQITLKEARLNMTRQYTESVGLPLEYYFCTVPFPLKQGL